MLKVHLKDGTTLQFDLTRSDDNRQWRDWSVVRDFQAKISGLAILHQKKMHALRSPKACRRLQFEAELVYGERNGQRCVVGERIICLADDLKISLMIYTNQMPIYSVTEVQRVTTRSWSYEAMFSKRKTAS